MIGNIIRRWFKGKGNYFGDFVSAMFKGNVDEMNYYMNRVALETFSYFDSGNKPSEAKEPERFYHGFVLGLLVDKASEYIVKSNRESGFGRYDVVMEPKNKEDVAVIMEFKVQDQKAGEDSLDATAEAALSQIEEMHYESDLLSRGIPAERIYKYGFAFRGEECLIKKG
ncbi:MAG: PD-(D/E)XK nuclease domain-containing protein [Lachnospiraceae bacterium]|nr:PD-(D/E)XK nuclease domain-containing protein [Lachnospiraceae bacterium]